MTDRATRTLVGQLRGATRLAVEATKNVTDVVEDMHRTIAGGPQIMGEPLRALSDALTAPVYGAVRGVTAVVGGGLDVALSSLSPWVDQAGADRGWLLAVLNGVLGDYLAETDNPLAIQMALCSDFEPVPLCGEALGRAFPEGDRLLVLVHGCAMDDSAWGSEGGGFGDALQRDTELLPLFLRYNSGRHISENGRAFAELLHELERAWPRPVRELVLVAHSMGGLVCRSACACAEERGYAWRSALTSLVMLGTPHHGAPLERGGNWVHVLLGINRYSAPLARLARLRSAGVTDLRYGNVRDSDWQGTDRFAAVGDQRASLSLPDGVACYAVAGIAAAPMARNVLGDGLVPVYSALGRHRDPALDLGFEADCTWIASATGHMQLLTSEAVYQRLCTWLLEARQAAT